MTSIPDFINAQNLEYARNHTMNPKYRDFTVGEAYEDDVQMLGAKQRAWRRLYD